MESQSGFFKRINTEEAKTVEHLESLKEKRFEKFHRLVKYIL
jgi:hypothetical protein